MSANPRTRSDYALSEIPKKHAKIESVEQGSPADKAGLQPGFLLTRVEDVELTDLLDWQWHSDGDEVFVEGIAYPDDPQKSFEFECLLTREYGQTWGIEFDGVVFDGIRTCKNACIFCFMSMLPKNLRDSLYVRDDDYRLSFMQGNFVTFTNMTPHDVQRVKEYHLSPLNMSLHAIDKAVRKKMIGAHEARGVEVLEELLEAGIEIHAQIVLVPQENDGEILRETLEYVYNHPLITSCGIVPLGFTKYQKRFSKSFADEKDSAAVVRIVEEYQHKALKTYGQTRYQLADEFYLWAHSLPPQADFYDGYPQFYDGIGMYRSFLDDYNELLLDEHSILYKVLQRAHNLHLRIACITGTGFAQALKELAGSSYDVIPITNNFFGGNVDVTGLMNACDILDQAPLDLSGYLVTLPEVMFNFDGLTLDGMKRHELLEQLEDRGARACVVRTEPYTMFEDLWQALNI